MELVTHNTSPHGPSYSIFMRWKRWWRGGRVGGGGPWGRARISSGWRKGHGAVGTATLVDAARPMASFLSAGPGERFV